MKQRSKDYMFNCMLRRQMIRRIKQRDLQYAHEERMYWQFKLHRAWLNFKHAIRNAKPKETDFFREHINS